MQENYNNANLEVEREKIEKHKKVKKGFETAKAAVGIVGGIATAIMIACPFDGPVGDIIALAATGVLEVAVVGAEKIYDNVVDIPNENTDTIQNVANINQELANEAQNAKKIIDVVQKYKTTDNTMEQGQGVTL